MEKNKTLQNLINDLETRFGFKRDQNVAIVNFNSPSHFKRLAIYLAPEYDKVKYYYVAHGRNSGSIFAKEFSNEPGSLKSCLGVFKVLNYYVGKHGKSARIAGLDNTNDNAEARNIVVHGAYYVSDDFLDKWGRLGRSEGCFAVDEEAIKEILNLLAPGSYIYSYRNES